MLWLRVAPYVVIVALLGWIGWLKYDAAKVEGRIAQAKLDAQTKAKEVSDAVIKEVTANLARTQATKETYVEKVVATPATAYDDACRRSERQRVATRGVRDTVLGSAAPTQRGTTDAVRATVSGAGPGQPAGR